MNKEKLVERIGQIPKFILRDVAVSSKPEITIKADKVWEESEKDKAVTEEGNLVTLAYVSNGYQLVQFSDVFLKLIENIGELEGNILYYRGVGLMDIFPSDEKLKVNGGNDRIGMVGINSVDKTSSVIIKFCISHDGKVITVPKNLAGFKRMHVGKVIQVTSNFLAVVDKVRQIWKIIIDEFTKIKVDETYATTVMDEVEINDKYMRKKVMKRISETSDMDLWDMFLYMIEIVEERSFKSDLHRRKKLDLISDKMFKWAVTCKLLNA